MRRSIRWGIVLAVGLLVGCEALNRPLGPPVAPGEPIELPGGGGTWIPPAGNPDDGVTTVGEAGAGVVGETVGLILGIPAAGYVVSTLLNALLNRNKPKVPAVVTTGGKPAVVKVSGGGAGVAPISPELRAQASGVRPIPHPPVSPIP